MHCSEWKLADDPIELARKLLEQAKEKNSLKTGSEGVEAVPFRDGSDYEVIRFAVPAFIEVLGPDLCEIVIDSVCKPTFPTPLVVTHRHFTRELCLQ
jgi:hypothetical protein